MRKFLLLSIVSIGLMQFTSAQYQRLVLFEEFTQASCGPCASQNPGFNALLQDNEIKAISIKYQVWWPGYDPMYFHNTPDVDNRVSYYGVSGVPHATIDGVDVANDCAYYTGAPACVDQAEIDAQYAVTSPFNMTVTHSFNADYSIIYIHVDVTAGDAVTGSLKLRTVVTEKEVLFDVPPGSNGEMEFYGVMKKMLPNEDGTTTGDFSDGETKSYDFEWPLANIYNLNNLMIVAFMQDDAGQAVLQAGKSEPNTGLPVLDYAVNSVTSVTCTTSYDPIVNVTNNSDEALTALDLSYSVDGGAASVYGWTGSIAAGASGDITLPTVTLGGGGSHDIDIEIAGVGVIDINMVNNNLVGSISVLSNTAVSVEQDFQETDFPPADWAVDNLSDGSGWVRGAGGVGGYGESSASAKAPFYTIAPGAIFDLYLPKMDLSTYTSDVLLTFDLANAVYTVYNDRFQILASEDCGDSWDILYDKEDPDLMTGGNSTADWKPGDDDWITEEIDLAAYAGMSDILVMLRALSGFGNNLYIDNIRISSSVAIHQIDAFQGFSIFPNPATDNFSVNVDLNEGSDVSVSVIDVTGKVISTYNLGTLAAGNNTFYVNASGFAAGLYNVVINVNGLNAGSEFVVINK